MSEKWYRYEVRRYAPPVDEFDNICGTGRVEVVLLQIRVVKQTPKGVRLATGRFVLRNARKRYACPTITEARESFLARKAKQIRILRAQIAEAQAAAKCLELVPIHTIPNDCTSAVIGHRTLKPISILDVPIGFLSFE